MLNVSFKQWNTTLTPQDKPFYEALGKRIAQFRKAQNLTQTQVAETLGMSQKTVAHYEGGKLRVPVALLPILAKLLIVSVEDIIGEPARPAKRGPTSKLQRQVDQIRQMPRNKQRLASDMLEAIIQQQAS
jgi:transcriptional regulator with XRE-family HTH domain